MRTASRGGNWLRFRNRRTFAYDAVSTSMENVARFSCAVRINGLSVIRSYASVLGLGRTGRSMRAGGAAAGGGGGGGAATVGSRTSPTLKPSLVTWACRLPGQPPLPPAPPAGADVLAASCF